MASTNTFDVLKERGFVRQVTDETAVRELFSKERVTAYVGYDPTAGSLHIGNLVTLMALRHLARGGHRPLVLLGGGTVRVGDPSGKTEMRQMLEEAQIIDHTEAIRAQTDAILGLKETHPIVEDNAEWLLKLNYISFLRDVGRHFSVNRMLSAESVKIRLERGLSFLEFNYQLLQAYDFHCLLSKHGCRVQMGGDDQWGNIVAGVDLCRRLDQTEVFGVTFPLLLTARGEKMGKTASGAVWLDPTRVSPFEYYQYWVNTHDDDVVRFLGFFTELPMEEIKRIEGFEGAALNQAKTILAFESTAIVHGNQAALEAHRAAQGAFGGRDLNADILASSTCPRTQDSDATQIPTTLLSRSDFVEGAITVVDLLLKSELSDSKRNARRLMGQGAVRIGDEVVNSPEAALMATAISGEGLLVRVGKKRLHRFVIE